MKTCECGNTIICDNSRECRRCAQKRSAMVTLNIMLKIQVEEELRYLIALYQDPTARAIVGADYADKRIKDWHEQQTNPHIVRRAAAAAKN